MGEAQTGHVGRSGAALDVRARARARALKARDEHADGRDAVAWGASIAIDDPDGDGESRRAGAGV